MILQHTEWIGAAESVPRIHPAVDPEWLASGLETPISIPEGSIDAHFHLWNRINDRFLASDFAKEIKNFPSISDGIYVQCRTAYWPSSANPDRQPLGEVEHVVRQAEVLKDFIPNFNLWMIAGFDLTLDEKIIDLIAEGNEISGGKIIGIRNQTAWSKNTKLNTSPFKPPVNLLKDQRFVKGAKLLGQNSLVLDIWAYQDQLNDVINIARKCPNTNIVLNHLGGPLGGSFHGYQSKESRNEWIKYIKILAKHENVSVKISGIGLAALNNFFINMEKSPSSKEIAKAISPFFDHLLDSMGSQRLLFGSNFNVDNGVCNYINLINSITNLTENLTKSEKRNIFGDSARLIYNIS